MNTDKSPSWYARDLRSRTVTQYHQDIIGAINSGRIRINPGFAQNANTLNSIVTDFAVGNLGVLPADPPPAPPAPAIDTIVASLSTNRAAYLAAAPGSWVSITKAEYDAMQTNVTGTVITGASDTLLYTNVGSAGAIVVDYTANYLSPPNVTNNSAMFMTNVTDATVVPPIKANSYVYAFAICSPTFVDSTLNGIGNDEIQVYTNSSTSSYTGFIQLGGTVPATSTSSNLGNGYIPPGSTIQILINYYVLRSPSSTNGSGDGLLGIYGGTQTVTFTSGSTAIFTPGSPTNAGQIVAAYANDGNGVRYFLGGAPTASDTIADFISPGVFPNPVVCIQGLTTPIVQWT